MKKPVLIWDWPLRVFHWAFALCVSLAWLTSELGDDYIEQHMQLGYVIIGLITFRIIWGFVGPTHARFTSFVKGPKTVLAYLKNKQSPTAGHNPMGALMVLVMLLVFLLQSVSGLFIDDQVFSSGPYFGVLDSDMEKLMSSIHHTLGDIFPYLIGLHILAIVIYKLVKKEDLVTPMITGKKEADELTEQQKISNSKWKLALVIALLVAAFVYWLVVINPPAPVDDYFY